MLIEIGIVILSASGYYPHLSRIHILNSSAHRIGRASASEYKHFFACYCDPALTNQCTKAVIICIIAMPTVGFLYKSIDTAHLARGL